MRPRLCVPAAVAAAAVASCGGKVVAPVTMPVTTGAQPVTVAPPEDGGIDPHPPDPQTPGERVTPSRLFPELDGARGRVATEDGTERFLVDRMRLLVRADGSLERAAELLPSGNVQSIVLPSRLGGGYLFHVGAGSGTEIWRASGWLAKLRPLTRWNGAVAAIVPGFDRLYVQLTASIPSSSVVALDPWSGERIGLGPLPVASNYGQLAFADGWRAVVDTELRGPLTTFDAGATWRAVGVAERPQGVGIVDGNPAVLVHGGRYLIDARGGVTYHTNEEDVPGRLHLHDDQNRRRDEDYGREARRPSPLGKHPLRAAVEDGWPAGDGTALVARGGALGRVSLSDGAVLALAEDAYPERRSTCHAAHLGLHDVGFLCGEHEGPTTVYAYAPPLALRPVLRYEKPRFAAASGNGALVLRGRCADDPGKGESDARWYCVRTPAGALREIRVQGADADLGVERVIGLGDGRIVVLVPPRGGSAGVLSILSGGSRAGVPLALPTGPEGALRELKRGMWLDGFEERRPGVLGGWVEAGGPFLGVEITLDGQVKAGELREEAGGAIVGGRFAVALGEGGHAFETSDGGMSWAPFDLPDRDVEARAAPSRGCGPVGCSLPGWVRVGWGTAETPDDMKPAEAPPIHYPTVRISPTLHFDCSVSTVATPPLAEKHLHPAPRSGPRRAVPPARGVPRDSLWSAFRNAEAPALAADEYGVDNGPGPGDESTPLRAYAWGKSGADWTRNGRWMVRFDDRFDATGGLRSSAVTASLWPHQAEALEAVGTHAGYGGVAWSAFLDPSGRSLLAVACRGSSLLCALYSVGDGQPVLALRAANASPALSRPSSGGAVRVGEAWFFLSQPSTDVVTLWRADLGVARPIGSYPRLPTRANVEGPFLVRRAYGTDLGLLIGATAERGELWYVLPVDPESGVLGEAIALGPRDFTGTSLSRCAPEQDGWLFDERFRPGATTTTTNVEISNARARVDPVEMRMRLDPGRVCVESLAASTDRLYPLDARGPAPLQPLTAPPAKTAGGEAGSVPLAVTEKWTGRRWGLTCKMRVGESAHIGGPGRR